MTQTGPVPPAGPLAATDAAETYVQRRTREGIAILTFAGPDGNRFSPDLVQALARAIDTAERDPGVRAVVLTGRGADFCAGPWQDLPPPGPQAPEVPPVLGALSDLCDMIAEARKPVVCAVHGRVYAAGLALVLASSGCVADARAMIHAPETRLGRLPAGQAAVRAAWRLGAREALALLESPTPVPVAMLARTGLVQQIAPDALIPAAEALALRLVTDHPARDGGLADAKGFRDAVRAARARPMTRAAETMLVDVVEAAQLLPPSQALAFDRVRAEDLSVAPEARAFAHLARATRRALDTPESRSGQARPRSGPIAAALGDESAQRLVLALLHDGATLTLLEPDRATLTARLERLADDQLRMIGREEISRAQAETDWQRLSGRLQIEGPAPAFALADPDRAAWIESQLPADTPLFIWSPTATGIPALAHPARAVELVPAPTHRLRLCEIVVRAGTDAETVRQASGFLIGQGLTPLRSARQAALPVMIATAASVAERMRGLGVAPDTIARSGIIPPAFADGPVGPATALPLPAERLMVLAMINAGIRLLESGVCLRPSDLDLAMVLGAGWPNGRGGPMAEADGIGTLVLRHELRQAEALDPALWRPEPMLDEMIRQGWRFEDLNIE
ncbi:MAG: enoyl-CoA hydratase-related protein [Paracoccaceae bacterium]